MLINTKTMTDRDKLYIRDKSIYWSEICGFSLFLHISFEALARVSLNCTNVVFEKLESLSYPTVTTACSIRLLVLTHYQRVTDRKTDTPPIPVSWSDIADRDKHKRSIIKVHAKDAHHGVLMLSYRTLCHVLKIFV